MLCELYRLSGICVLVCLPVVDGLVVVAVVSLSIRLFLSFFLLLSELEFYLYVGSYQIYPKQRSQTTNVSNNSKLSCQIFPVSLFVSVLCCCRCFVVAWKRCLHEKCALYFGV